MVFCRHLAKILYTVEKNIWDRCPEIFSETIDFYKATKYLRCSYMADLFDNVTIRTHLCRPVPCPTCWVRGCLLNPICGVEILGKIWSAFRQHVMQHKEGIRVGYTIVCVFLV